MPRLKKVKGYINCQSLLSSPLFWPVDPEWIQWKIERKACGAGGNCIYVASLQATLQQSAGGKRESQVEQAVPIGEEQKWPKARYKAAWAHKHTLLYTYTLASSWSLVAQGCIPMATLSKSCAVPKTAFPGLCGLPTPPRLHLCD
jgi:hypothetical protein